MKRTVLLILCAALLCSAMSCGESEPRTTDTTAATVDTATLPTETELAPDLPDVNYKGADFTILNGNTTTWMTIAKVTAEEENGDNINDAIYRRNLAVEEKYGVNIVEVPSDSARADLLEAIAAGDKAYDIALMVMADALTVTLENSALDYASVPHLDTSKPWWVAGTADRMSLGGHVYYAISQFDTTHYDGVRTFFFNKKLVEDFALDNPYQLVYDGKWTLDAMKTMGLKVAQDLNGDAKWGE
ncbi:MAG: extracellular solute-binding protein, partial [Clostridia bacterium]|nr:extracellular solute-binding protein [Clostridia bacterium]